MQNQNHTCITQRSKRYSITHTRYSLITQRHEYMQVQSIRRCTNIDVKRWPDKLHYRVLTRVLP